MKNGEKLKIFDKTYNEERREILKNILRKKIIKSILGVFFFLFTTTNVCALPIVSVAPISQTVNLNDIFTVDINISGIDPLLPLNAFEFDLDFDSSILSPLSITYGGFIPPLAIIVESDITAPDVNFAVAGLFSAGSGDGMLATIGFQAISLGLSTLDLNDVILSSWFGVPITASIYDGSVSVISNPIPEPSTLLLFGFGLAGMAGFLFRRRGREQG